MMMGIFISICLVMVPKNDPKNLNVFIIFGGLRIFDHQLCFILELFS